MRRHPGNKQTLGLRICVVIDFTKGREGNFDKFLNQAKLRFGELGLMKINYLALTYFTALSLIKGQVVTAYKKAINI